MLHSLFLSFLFGHFGHLFLYIYPVSLVGFFVLDTSGLPLTRSLLHHQHVPVKTYWIATFGWFVIAIMTVILFYRLILSDFGKMSHKSTHRSNENSHDKFNSSGSPSSTSSASSTASSSSSTAAATTTTAAVKSCSVAGDEALYPLLRSR